MSKALFEVAQQKKTKNTSIIIEGSTVSRKSFVQWNIFFWTRILIQNFHSCDNFVKVS